MKGHLSHLRAAIYSTPWAIVEDRLMAIAEVVERRALGVRLEPEAIDAIRGERSPYDILSVYEAGADGNFTSRQNYAADQPASGGQQYTAVINVTGIIAQHARQVNDMSGPGGTSVQGLQQAFRTALADPNIGAIVFNVDSPGGSVSGVQMMAEEIFAARGKKPMIAQCNSMMCSAAYWIGSAADEIAVTPGGMIGSIGVYGVHVDQSAKNEADGVKFTMIKAGKYKAEGRPFEPLTSEAAKAMQDNVNSYYGDFVKGVAAHRGVSTEDVRSGLGQGRAEKDSQAVKSKLADRVATLDQTLQRAAKLAQSSKSKMRAMSLPEMSATGVSNLIVHTKDGHKSVVGDVPEQFVSHLDFIDSLSEVSGVEGYEPIGFDASTSSVIFGKKPEAAPVADTPSAEDIAAAAQSAAERDAYRRRRHAHRMRSATS